MKDIGGRRTQANERCRWMKDAGATKLVPDMCYPCGKRPPLPLREMLRQEKHPRYPEMIRLLVYGKCAVVALRNISGGLHADSLSSVLR